MTRRGGTQLRGNLKNRNECDVYGKREPNEKVAECVVGCVDDHFDSPFAANSAYQPALLKERGIEMDCTG
jgi:hypothetical protein